jgi:GalNAc-alpha-(1->4)-GalNAc-alpha-(1->3)-diNAcBac-PP-undecaprenol alpha-1,4-N-acetyl-D-galactosaminyltransferase
MKKICLVIPSLQPGGMERVMSELAGRFCQKSNLEVHLILYDRDPVIFYKIPENLLIHKPKSRFNNKLRFIYTIGRLRFLRWEIIRIKPDAILSFGEYWNSFVLLALYGLTYPVFVSDRCQPDKGLSRFHDALRIWLYPKASGLIAQTKVAKEIFENRFKNSNILIISNPIRRIMLMENIENEHIILTVGRLIKTKHHDKLIRIFSKLNAPDWKLVIVGGNALKQDGMSQLQNLITELNLCDRVILTGEQSDVDEYYRKSSIFAFTSSSEGFPNVIGEALSAGLPVVSYDCIAGPSEMIKDGENGYLVRVFDDKTFQDKLQMLISDNNLRNEMSGVAKASVDQFSIENIGDRFLNVILNNQ